jgi:TIR domain
MQRDVFVSYAQVDRECALTIVAHLETCGVSVWVAPRDVQPSADWAAEIIDAIASTRLMVLVFSAASNESAQVRREVERAVHRQRPILPFRVEDVLPTKGMEYFLSSQHWLDAFPPPLAPHYERLCEQVTGILRGTHPVETTTQHLFSRETLQTLQVNLAEHIGPIASYLVGRAAATAVNRDELVNALATEIDSPVAQRQFIESSHKR